MKKNIIYIYQSVWTVKLKIELGAPIENQCMILFVTITYKRECYKKKSQRDKSMNMIKSMLWYLCTVKETFKGQHHKPGTSGKTRTAFYLNFTLGMPENGF